MIICFEALVEFCEARHDLFADFVIADLTRYGIELDPDSHGPRLERGLITMSKGCQCPFGRGRRLELAVLLGPGHSAGEPGGFVEQLG